MKIKFKNGALTVFYFVSIVSQSNSQTLIGEIKDINGIGIVNALIQDPKNPFNYTKSLKKGMYSTTTLTENLSVEIRAFGYQTRIVNLKNNQVYVLNKDLSDAMYLYHNDVDFIRAGLYTKDECKADFRTGWANGFVEAGSSEENTDRVYIDPAHSMDGKGKSVRIWYPKGKVDTKESGAQWRINLNGEYDDLYLSYWVRFSPNFDFTLGGKLPGFDGSEGGYDSREKTWSGKIMWRENGQAEFYLHPPGARNKERFWWNNLGEIAKFKRGVWQNIQIHYRLNEVGKKNGTLEAWLDGVQVGKVANTDVFRTIGEENIKINNLFFSTFYGGDITYAPSKEEYAWFDEFTVSTSKIPYPPNLATALYNSLEMDLDKTFYVYPNPSQDGVFQLSKDTKWMAYSVLGRELKSGNSNQIDLSEFTKGVYLVKINETIQRIVVE